MKLDVALKKVTTLPGVEAAFVFDKTLAILAREVSPHYGNEILKRIANQLLQIVELSWPQGSITQEFRISFEKHVVYVRMFAKNYYLVSFLEKTLDPAELRQPLNLAVLVLEKALRGGDSQPLPDASGGAMSRIAFLAEQSMRSQVESEASFVGAFRKICYGYLGPVGVALIENGIEEKVLVFPVHLEQDMKTLLTYVVENVPHPIKRRLIEEDGMNVIRGILKEKGILH